MATIGTFTKSGDSFTGWVKTLSINAKASIRPADKASDKAPDYRVFAGPSSSAPLGARPPTRAVLPVDQARRPELPGADIRQPGRR